MPCPYIQQYEAHFYALFRYFYDSISTESEKIQKFMKDLDVSCQLATSQMVVLEAPFWIIVDHAKMAEGILSASQGGTKKVRHFGEFRSHTSRGRDFRGSCGYRGRTM